MKRGSGISEGEGKTQAHEVRLPRRLMDIGIILLQCCAVRPLSTRLRHCWSGNSAGRRSARGLRVCRSIPNAVPATARRCAR